MRTTTDSTLDNNTVKRTFLWPSTLFCFKKNKMMSRYIWTSYLSPVYICVSKILLYNWKEMTILILQCYAFNIYFEPFVLFFFYFLPNHLRPLWTLVHGVLSLSTITHSALHLVEGLYVCKYDAIIYDCSCYDSIHVIMFYSNRLL